MTPQTQLRIANIIMLAGTVPLLFYIVRTVSTLAATDFDKQSQVGDVVLAIGMAIFAYAFAFIVSGGAALWSGVVANRNTAIRVAAARAIRIFVCVVLVLPLLLTAF